MKIGARAFLVAQWLSLLLMMIVPSGCYTVVVEERQSMWYPEPFELRYQFGNNEFNSVECKVRKDLVMDGYATAFFCLSEHDKYKIWRTIREMGIEQFPARVGSATLVARRLTLRVGNIEKDITWSISGEPVDDTEVWLMTLEKILGEILRPVFQAMPPRKGGNYL